MLLFATVFTLFASASSRRCCLPPPHIAAPPPTGRHHEKKEGEERERQELDDFERQRREEQRLAAERAQVGGCTPVGRDRQQEAGCSQGGMLLVRTCSAWSPPRPQGGMEGGGYGGAEAGYTAGPAYPQACAPCIIEAPAAALHSWLGVLGLGV